MFIVMRKMSQSACNQLVTIIPFDFVRSNCLKYDQLEFELDGINWHAVNKQKNILLRTGKLTQVINCFYSQQ